MSDEGNEQEQVARVLLDCASQPPFESFAVFDHSVPVGKNLSTASPVVVI